MEKGQWDRKARNMGGVFYVTGERMKWYGARLQPGHTDKQTNNDMGVVVHKAAMLKRPNTLVSTHLPTQGNKKHHINRITTST